MPRQAGFDTSVCFECAFWALPLQAMGKKQPAFRSVKQEKITVHGYNLLYILPAKYSFSCSMACRVRKNPSKHLIKTHPGRVWKEKKKSCGFLQGSSLPHHSSPRLQVSNGSLPCRPPLSRHGRAMLVPSCAETSMCPSSMCSPAVLNLILKCSGRSSHCKLLPRQHLISSRNVMCCASRGSQPPESFPAGFVGPGRPTVFLLTPRNLYSGCSSLSCIWEKFLRLIGYINSHRHKFIAILKYMLCYSERTELLWGETQLFPSKLKIWCNIVEMNPFVKKHF